MLCISSVCESIVLSVQILTDWLRPVTKSVSSMDSTSYFIVSTEFPQSVVIYVCAGCQEV